MLNITIHGVIVYTVLNNDTLSGVWTNIGHKTVLTDCAKKIEGSNNELDGTYRYTYIDGDNEVYSGDLKIEKKSDLTTYNFNWSIKSGDKTFSFSGIGFTFEPNKIAVSYIDIF